ncbi:hypothetical protein HYT84_01630 [Candidatus Micrarchaeota archaeon]|nr:hypothetical protein [Candidatus Micrarchaeota archaeon]
MSHLVNLSDGVYEELTKLKKVRDMSYSEVIYHLIHEKQIQKTTTWDDALKKIRLRDKQYKGKKEKIDHDLIAYGVSRDSS